MLSGEGLIGLEALSGRVLRSLAGEGGEGGSTLILRAGLFSLCLGELFSDSLEEELATEASSLTGTSGDLLREGDLVVQCVCVCVCVCGYWLGIWIVKGNIQLSHPNIVGC